jgi:hypothetical protein
MEPYYDRGLARRAEARRRELEAAATRVLEQQMGPDAMARIEQEAQHHLEGIEDLVRQVNEALAVDPFSAGVDYRLARTTWSRSWTATRSPSCLPWSCAPTTTGARTQRR